MARWNRLVVCFFLFLCLQLAVGHVVPVRRQDSSATAVTSTTRTGTRDAAATASSTSPARSTAASVTGSIITSSTSSISSALPTATDGVTFDNSTLLNSTIPEGQLPLEPKVTPGWAVAGVILLCVGVGYTLVGLRQPVMHNTLSVAYAVGLGITVLVVYLAPLPVSNGAQGGFVVAAVLPGILVGVFASLWFNEITECFACGLGGFCFSMWLLCLQEGGLLSGVAKVVFIVVFTLAVFAAYFTRWTRDWALIVSISFTGATSTVIGIDCFSRAGLKEFWAYIWHLNDNLFPVGATTYPLTKGIRVELAAIIVIFCVGIISQKRLWNVIKDRRTKRQEELAEEQRARDEEELNIGKQIEAENARERRAWERVHGDHDSGFARDSESEKEPRYSQSASVPGPEHPMVAEMQGCDAAPPVPPKPTPQGLMSLDKEDSMVTVRVAPDEAYNAPTTPRRLIDEKEAMVHTTEINDESTREADVPPVPEVVPLPFRFPVPDENTRGRRASTVATFADDDEDQEGVVSKRSSLTKRLSKGSVSLMRKVSQRTTGSRPETGPNEDEVAVLKHHRKETDSSIAATIDSENDSGASTLQESRPQTADVNQKLSQDSTEKASAALADSTDDEKDRGDTNADTADNAVDNIQEKPTVETPAADNTVEKSEGEPTKQADSGDSITEGNPMKQAVEPATPSQKAKSTASVHSTPVSLTPDRLPPALSNVALHYRTNEWAKHLSHAEAPAPETLPVVEYTQDAPQREETPAPLNVEELKQTALTATPAPVPTPSPAPLPAQAHPRPTSTFTAPRTHSRNNSWGSGIDNPNTPPPPMIRKHHRRVSSKNQVPTVQTIAEESHLPSRSPSVSGSERMPMAASPISPSGFVPPPPPPGIVSYSSPQSLLAQRSMAIRNKTYGILTGANSTPDFSAAAQRPPSEVYSAYDYPGYPQQMAESSLDDLPLSQRKEMIRRQSSMGTIRTSMSDNRRSLSNPYPPTTSTEKLQFDSHQPSRVSNAPSREAREARLASFRDSVQADLRNASAVAKVGAHGRDTSMMFRASSSANLAAQAAAREADMQRNIDLQRSFLMSQKEAEAKRREKERIEKERSEQAFTRSMQTGEMFDLHREAMKRMQQGSRNA
ncbi:sulfite exporter family protein [Colletotrichum asianum]